MSMSGGSVSQFNSNLCHSAFGLCHVDTGSASVLAVPLAVLAVPVAKNCHFANKN